MRKWAILLPIILLAGLLQQTNVFGIFGVKPNLLLAILIPATFFLDQMLMVVGLLAIALLVSDFRAGFAEESASLALLILAAPLLGRRLPWNPFVNNIILVAGFTLIFYLLTGPGYIFGAPLRILWEIVYNCLFATLFFNTLNACIKTNSMLKI